jgi:hypothetical protein
LAYPARYVITPALGVPTRRFLLGRAGYCPQMHIVVTVLARTVCGGLLELLFAELSEALAPKRFAGILGAAPSVAIAGLALGSAANGAAEEAMAAHTMIAGAVALTVYAAIAAVVIPRRGVAVGAVVGSGGWLVVAAALTAVLI